MRYALVFLSLQPKYNFYSRRVYSFMEMLGDVGGLNDAIHIIFGFFPGLILAKSFGYGLVTNNIAHKKNASKK